MRTTRILCLHGYHGSAAILGRQIAPSRRAFPLMSSWSLSPPRRCRRVALAGGARGFAGGRHPGRSSASRRVLAREGPGSTRSNMWIA